MTAAEMDSWSDEIGTGFPRDYTISPDRYAAITLASGSHSAPDQGMCLMEAVAFLVGEQHSDRPVCVSPVLGEFGRGLNDCFPDNRRQGLLALIPSLPGTAGDGLDEARSYMALDWLIRVHLPAFLDLSPSLREDAAKVRELGRIVDLASAERAGPVVRRAQKSAAAARDAAWAAAGDAAWAAARDAAGDAAWAAARAALAPTVEMLQDSAIELYAEMIKAPWVA